VRLIVALIYPLLLQSITLLNTQMYESQMELLSSFISGLDNICLSMSMDILSGIHIYACLCNKLMIFALSTLIIYLIK